MIVRAATSGGVRKQQQTVDAYFEKVAPYWKKIYERTGVYAAIHQERQALVLAEFELIGLPPQCHILEIGCGAGLATVALAQRGYQVEAVDRVPEMVDSTRDLAARAGVQERVAVSLADVHELPFPNGAFQAVLAIGVMPWLLALERPVREIARVLAPGGYLIVNADNRWGFQRLLDPQLNPLLTPLKTAIRGVLIRLQLREARVRAQVISNRKFDRALSVAGLEKLRGRTLGFGPFTLFNRELLAASSGLRLHHRLQDLADRGTPIIRSAGAQYMVVARKAWSNAF